MITYDGVHARLRQHRGPAKDQWCVRCGGPALHWAYDHRDAGEVIDGKTGLTYSLNEDHYLPMCAACHLQDDRDHRGSTPHGNEKKTHCPAKHEYTPENTEIQAAGWRICRTCHLAAGRAQSARLTAMREWSK
jgi:hypothetical protein